MIEKRYTMDDERWYAYEMHEKYLHDQATLKCRQQCKNDPQTTK